MLVILVIMCSIFGINFSTIEDFSYIYTVKTTIIVYIQFP